MSQEAQPLYRRRHASGAIQRAPAAHADSALIRLARWLGGWTISAVQLGARLMHNVFVGGDNADVAAGDARQLLLRQVHIAGVRALPLVCLVAAGTGAAIVLQTSMAPTAPSAEFGRMLVVVVLRELAPLLTALIVVGHSGTAVAAELGPDQPVGPRVAGTTIALSVLAVYFAAIAMLAGYAVSQMLTLRTFDAVRAGFEQELAWFDVPLFLVKTCGLGAIVGYISCRFALEAASSAAKAARAASRSYVWTLLLAGAFSIGITAARYLITGAPQPP